MRFVVLKHTQPIKQVPFPRRRYLQMMADGADKATIGAVPKGHDVHFDLMLESDDGLLTWAMGCLPMVGKNCGAIKLPLHRKFYLTHQGPVSQGRGTVQMMLTGNYQLATPDRVLLHTSKHSLVVEMIEIQPDHFRFSFFSHDKAN